MQGLRQFARAEMRFEQLHLAVRGGMGLEDFYKRLGWRGIGRWPNALCPATDDTRDEALMILAPLTNEGIQTLLISSVARAPGRLPVGSGARCPW